MEEIEVIDSHTGGEPTRTVIRGFPDLGNGSMAERLTILRRDFDKYRQAVINEPRGSDVLVGALLCEPVDPESTVGVIFFNNTGYLSMCGHGTIGVVASLAYLGKIAPGVHRIETPVGVVEATLDASGKVSIKNVPAYCYKQSVTVEVPNVGSVEGDIAWGGNWFFLVENAPCEVVTSNIEQLTDVSWRIRQALTENGVTGADGAEIDHIELFAHDDVADSRSFVLCPGKAYDRSPCGTGTSAKLACLAAREKLAPDVIWHQASIIGSQFEASYVWDISRDGNAIIPTIKGQAYISGYNRLILDDNDPFCWGIAL
ncbi:4-hydroxyproline epimerase [Vibrio ziniensis]|uniref:4-hydroxyproline epimerase n=1 Tax=Vibrio ziniensis TaxID=2711221 RepID=A0A6G7CIZ7_9VIBR|nr:4-hydroxyproline epimerase [Vibrio ziniensis]QIH42087.1 4-hydroxyproline epimerase [Vibrio ziniensis]